MLTPVFIVCEQDMIPLIVGDSSDHEGVQEPATDK